MIMNRPAIFIITGEHGEGKSSFAVTLAGILIENQLKVKGIIAEGYWEGSVRSGFDLTDPDTGIKIPLAEKRGTDTPVTKSDSANDTGSGGFVFHKSALRKGNSIIRQAIIQKYDVIIIDEIGARELSGEIWSEPLEMLLRSHRGILLLTVRKKFLETVTGHWQIEPAGIFDISSVRAAQAAEIILRYISSRSPDAK